MGHTGWEAEHGIHHDAIDELPRIVQLRDNLFGAAFPLMKLLPARIILDNAERRGDLRPGAAIVESTSGTFGLALAILCARRGYALTLVGDSAIDAYLAARLATLGARVERIDRLIEEREGPQRARLERVKQIQQTDGAFWTEQYFNLGNMDSYRLVADHLLAALPGIDALIGTVGTGGSVCGTAIGLRQHRRALRVIGVDTHYSVLFGHPNGKRLLRGLGNSLIPANIRYEEFDEVHWVSAAEAYLACRALYKEHGLFMGGTSGAAFLVADWYARQHPDQTVVTLFPDEGHRYFDTVYNDDWVKTLPHWREVDFRALAPIAVRAPADELTYWSHYHWNRRHGPR
ncbi:MAG: cysteine synthase family protein [Paludibacterium sp.]|uniref:PLP-dependent cysteine synthase family protein n=1 Tax=Paludibacterium sp. TaxID=1917523 RepID=UPI0025DCE339|nr:cysteine synthase family protein [Paludibacterium sp.]MBV8049076.1 cysteine synthase family protein [Paludibacterium sp.]MBV8649414.1 cysteine synthase family protein [Paludibacterium sp.]